MKCPKCGFENNLDSTICAGCGYPLSSISSAGNVNSQPVTTQVINQPNNQINNYELPTQPVTDNSMVMNNKNKTIIILISLSVMLLILGLVLLLKSNTKKEEGKPSDIDNNILFCKVDTYFGRTIERVSVTTDQGYFSCGIGQKNFNKRDDLPFTPVVVQNGFYLMDNNEVYLYPKDFNTSIYTTTDKDYVQLASSIKQMSTSGYGCGLFLDVDNNVYAYNMIAKKETSCGFNRKLNFEKMNIKAKYVISIDDFNGYVDENNTFYGKTEKQDTYIKIMDDVKEVSYFPYILTSDHILYGLFGINDILNGLAGDIKVNTKISEKVDRFIDSNSKSGAFYEKENKVYYLSDASISIAELDKSKYLTREDYNTYYLNFVEAKDIKEILFYYFGPNFGDESNKQIGKFVYLDNQNKLHLYREGKEQEVVDYNLDGLLKVYNFVNNQ